VDYGASLVARMDRVWCSTLYCINQENEEPLDCRLWNIKGGPPVTEHWMLTSNLNEPLSVPMPKLMIKLCLIIGMVVVVYHHLDFRHSGFSTWSLTSRHKTSCTTPSTSFYCRIYVYILMRNVWCYTGVEGILSLLPAVVNWMSLDSVQKWPELECASCKLHDLLCMYIDWPPDDSWWGKLVYWPSLMVYTRHSTALACQWWLMPALPVSQNGNQISCITVPRPHSNEKICQNSLSLPHHGTIKHHNPSDSSMIV